MNNQIFIDGIDFTGRVAGINDLSVTFGLDDVTKTVNTSVTSGLIFYEDAYDYLQGKFFADSVGIAGRDLEANITIRINIPNCQTDYDFIIRGDLLEICFDSCRISTRGISRTADQEAYNKMTYEEIKATKRVEINRCFEFTFSQGLLLAVVNTLLITVAPIAVLIDGVLGTNFESDLIQIQQDAAGCEVNTFGILAHPMNNIMETTLSVVGLSFQSSILQSGTYSNTVYISKQTRPGTDAAGLLFVENFNTPLLSFINNAKILFNAEFRIKDGVLYFERKDFFFDNSNLLVDIDEVSTDTNPVCYRFVTEPEFAVGNYSFAEDSREIMGNEALGDYSDIVLWNEPFLPSRRDVNDVTVPFGAAKFTDDVYDTNPLLQNGVRPPGYIITSRDAEPFQAPKVVLVQSISSDPFTENAQVVYALDSNNKKRYNYPFYIGEGNNYNPAIEDEELYQNFYFIDDPRETPVAPYEIAEYTFKATGDQINLVVSNGIDVHILTRFGKGFPQEIDVNYANGTITVKNVKIVV